MCIRDRSLLTGFIAYFFFAVGGILFFTKQDGLENEESKIVSRGSLMISACLVGWIAALWVTEAVSLEREFFDIIDSFTNNPRYLSLLIVPLWFSRMLRTDTSGLSLVRNRNTMVVTICLMLLLNSWVLANSGPRGTDVVGAPVSYTHLTLPTILLV